MAQRRNTASIVARLSRRQFGQLLAAGGLLGASPRQWTVASEGCVQRLALRDGRFACTSLFHRETEREWIHPAAPSEEFRVRFEDGGKEMTLTGGSGWGCTGSTQSSLERGWNATAVMLDSPSSPLRITRHYLSHARLPVIRQWTTVTNTGTRPLRITRLDAFQLRVAPAPAPLELRWLNNFGRGMIPSPGNPMQGRIIEENTEQQIRTGPYSPDCAWFSLALAGGEMLIGGWEWSGPMVVSFGGGLEPCLISGGLDTDRMSDPLEPGASIDSPVGWYGFVRGDYDDAAALSHALVRQALAPPLPESDFPWAVYCTWASAIDRESNPHNEPGTHPWFPTERNLLGQVDAAAAIGCELFLWDFGWFPHIGDWWFDPARFPQGPRRVRRAVRERGMKLGLWFGFGNADDSSRVVREHPDWLAEYNGKPIPDDFFIRTAASTWNTRILCLAHRPAREWVKEQLARVIGEAELDWLKHDFDLITICQSRAHTHTPGDSRVASCEAFYEIMDFVRARYPQLVCEQWMNDSAVPDYGVLQRHHVQLIGDAYESFRLRQMVYGHTQIFPLDRQQRYLRIEDFKADLATTLQSSMIGGPWTLLTDPRMLDAEQRRTLAREIGFFKRFRGLAPAGRAYRLIARPHPRGWDAFQLWDEQRGEGVVYAFRNQHPAAAWPIRLKGLRHGTVYEAEFLRGRSSARLAGSKLMEEGLPVELPAMNTCELIALRRAGA